MCYLSIKFHSFTPYTDKHMPFILVRGYFCLKQIIVTCMDSYLQNITVAHGVLNDRGLNQHTGFLCCDDYAVPRDIV